MPVPPSDCDDKPPNGRAPRYPDPLQPLYQRASDLCTVRLELCKSTTEDYTLYTTTEDYTIHYTTTEDYTILYTMHPLHRDADREPVGATATTVVGVADEERRPRRCSEP